MTSIFVPTDERRTARTVDPARLRRASDAPTLRHARRLAALEGMMLLHGNARHPVRRLAFYGLLRGMMYSAALSAGCSRTTKRLVDVVASSLVLLALLPLFLAVAALIKRSDKGPVLFWQARVGRRGTTFWMPKFRSMRVDAERLKESLLGQNDHGSGVTFKMKNDPRVTPVGRFIRRFSIDELPQFWCVLKGEMTLVGPRPPVPREAARYTTSDRRRLEVKPGLTCFWQVGGRGDLPFERQVKLDVEYIERQSLGLDLLLLLKTIPAVLGGRGAY